MDERMKILQLLEDGKINAEEAAKLLEAVSRTGLRVPRPPKLGVHSEVLGDVMGGVSNVLDTIPSIIRHSTRLGGRGGKKTLNVKKKPSVRLSLVGGDMNLSHSEDEMIRGNLSSGIVTTRDTKDGLWIKCLGGDAEIQLPQIEALVVSVVGGDVQGEVDTDALAVKTLEGDISLTIKTLKTATIKSKSGDIDISIPADAEAEVDAYTMSGEIEFEPEMEIEEQTDNHIKGRMGEGGGNLTAVNLSGNITVKCQERD